MNILFFSADNDASSGAFLSMATLCESLNMFNVSSTVILPCKGDGQRILSQKGINYKYIKSFNWVYSVEQQKDSLAAIKVPVKKLLNFISITKVFYFIKKHKIDIVHINASDTYIGAYAAKMCKVPLIWHVREFITEDHGAQFWDEKRSYNTICSADYVIPVSNAVANKIRLYNNKASIRVIYNGIDPKLFSNNRKILEKKINDNFYCRTYMRWERTKGIYRCNR
ncbi:glycosyltransferase [Butyrivibrio fibrisolvens]|uniref:glycosyltransferase n=1 Tax=Butyrivibrio fibrisolvens TaxID=831 RepID=UPI0020C133FE|nr:glycosyltransferase [Butyrivibrio fibrisolvens]